MEAAGGEEGDGFCLPPEEWVRCARALRGFASEGYGESRGGTALGGMERGSVLRYAGLLERVGEGGGSVRGYLQGLAARRAKSASFRATLAAVRLCGQLGLVGGFGPMLFEDRMAQSARKYDLPSAQRHYVGERHLVEMARSSSTPEDFAILGVGIISLAFLLRVGEAALLSPSDIRGGGVVPCFLCPSQGRV